ncbi:MAG: hypothetical protein K8H74_09235 [Notoacmeibacter sp.]|nr:hypothetical protein [Notoacmeibacter sp.]
MPIFKILPQPQAYGYRVGVLLLDLTEAHVPGDTAHAGTYDYPVLFKVMEGVRGENVLTGDRMVEPAIISAAQELERMGVEAISSNCGFMLNYQDAVRSVVNIPVALSSLLQLPGLARMIRPDRKIAILAGAKRLVTRDLLRLAGLPDEADVVIGSIEGTPEFDNFMTADIDTDAFGKRLEEAADTLFEKHSDIGALLLECAIFTPYAAALQRRYNVPTADFVSLIDYLHDLTHRRDRLSRA